MKSINIPDTETYAKDIHAWETMLEQFQQENTLLKTQLAQVVDINTGKAFLDLAESFNSQFILKDECILDLKKDIEAHKKSLFNGLYLYPNHSKMLVKKHLKLRNEMEHFSQGISVLKDKFNNYLYTL